MAENDDGQEKSEQPTAKREREAREKGQVPRSRDFNTLIVLMTGSLFLVFFGAHVGARLAAQMADGFTLDRSLFYDTQRLLPYLEAQLGHTLVVLAPLLGVLFVSAILGAVLIGGGNISTKAMAPKFDKLNPLTGIKRMFSMQALLELAKTLGKFLVVTLVAAIVLWWFSGQLFRLGEQPVDLAIAHTANMAVLAFLLVSIGLVIIAMIDVPFQLWNFQKQLRMTKQELKDEFKETEGKPEVKGRIRRLQQEMARRRMMADVPRADVVITNPTHFAVALAYKAPRMRAPRLLAKGADTIAASIRTVATEHEVIIVEAPRVARAIYYTTEIGQEIPSGLFVAVARILAYVYQLRRHDLDVELPTDLPVPEEYLDPRSAARKRREDG